MNTNDGKLEDFENRIGYHFRDIGLLKTALTHTSYANEHRRQGCMHNERLEFLGDAVLETISSEYLYRKYPDKMEGELSKTRASMVCEPSLAKCARDLHLPQYLRLGRGEEQMGGRDKDSVISDALESVIGAIYLDGGFEKAAVFVRKFVLLDLHAEDLFRDSKTRLQEVVQEHGGHVEYEVIDETGPDHARCFTISAVEDGKVLGIGRGRTKKAAAQAAAHEALQSLAPQKRA